MIDIEKTLKIWILYNIVCPRSLAQFYVATRFVGINKTFWTFITLLKYELLCLLVLCWRIPYLFNIYTLHTHSHTHSCTHSHKSSTYAHIKTEMHTFKIEFIYIQRKTYLCMNSQTNTNTQIPTSTYEHIHVCMHS